ncbi:hypothetical protein F5Y12DRAFT_714431 [Xylaria sp. FL1777]|nr:hypothetical protein F5Y12DRAFT_714431 [Xylaria sp. FL1777]
MADETAQQNSLDESMMRAAEEELRRRRERGKQSQARFRKRQAQAAQETRAENEKMKAAIAEVVRATQHSDRLGLLRAVRAAADAAGIDASGLNEENHEEGVAIDDRNVAIDASVRGDGDGDTSTSIIRQKEPKPPTSHTWDEVSYSYSASMPGHLSPRLDYGIWIDASQAGTVSKPPEELIPFIGTRRYTFSGQLYWACSDYLISLCRVVTTPHLPTPWFSCKPGSRPTPREAEERVWKVLPSTPPMTGVRIVQAVAEAQREYRDCGYNQEDNTPCSEHLCTLVRQGSGRDNRKNAQASFLERGCDLSVWMTITELERHVRRRLGSEAFSRLEKAIAACYITNHSKVVDEEARAVVGLFVKNLAESYTCFGDGPRWRADTVSDLFNQQMTM